MLRHQLTGAVLILLLLPSIQAFAQRAKARVTATVVEPFSVPEFNLSSQDNGNTADNLTLHTSGNSIIVPLSPTDGKAGVLSVSAERSRSLPTGTGSVRVDRWEKGPADDSFHFSRQLSALPVPAETLSLRTGVLTDDQDTLRVWLEEASSSVPETHAGELTVNIAHVAN